MMKTSLIQQQSPQTPKKKRPYARNKVGEKQQRVVCTVCLKPNAVWYYENKKHNKIIYEHRDEPPIKEFTYRNEKTPRKRYRRCHTEVFKENPMNAILENKREEMQQQQQIPKLIPQKEISNGKDYKKMYFDLEKKYDALRKALRDFLK